jgi:hypothetical protein
MRFCALALAIVILSPKGRAQAQATGWTPIGTEHGFVISRRGGHGAPSFRGVGPIQGKIEDVLSVLRDVPSINQWAYGITQSRLIEHVSEDVDLIYLFSATPWPVRDRDMTVRREIHEVQPGSEYRITFRCQAGVLPAQGSVVRVNQCHSEFRLRRLNDHETELEYWARLDPAGHVPSWASSWMARTVPGRTLQSIQQRVSHKRQRTR